MGKMDDILREYGTDAAIISCPSDTLYLTGYDNPDCTIAAAGDELVYFTDQRYIEEARAAIDQDIDVRNGGMSDVCAHLNDCKVKAVAFDADKTTYSDYLALQEALCAKLVPVRGLLTEAREIKSSEELRKIANAQEITDAAFAEILPLVREGITEFELAAKLEYAMMSKGAKLAFDSIVAFGAHGSSPHAHRSDARLKKGDFVTMDFGARVDGYCSDMTRTVALGEVSDMQRNAYARVLAANIECVGAVRPGAICSDIDALARKILAQDGLDRYFVHSLGHGVGIDIHEEPTLSRRCGKPLAVGNVVTVEPGVYVEGMFGIRIEDMVVVSDGGCIDLTRSDKNLITL